jgi:hypothetical protein
MYRLDDAKGNCGNQRRHRYNVLGLCRIPSRAPVYYDGMDKEAELIPKI